MGKQAKKKQKTEGTAKDQQRHNRATRYSCSKNRPIVWDRAVMQDGDIYEVLLPPNTQWDWSRTHDAVTVDDGTTKLMPKKQPNLYEPFDTLLDDFGDNLRGFAEFHKAKIERDVVREGYFKYTVYREIVDHMRPKGKGRETLLTVDSSQNLNVGSPRRRRRRKR
jgi:hypothetical protein